MEIKKVYVTTPTLCKNGVIKPITRAHKETACDVCGLPMIIEKHVKGGTHKRAWTRWRCTDKTCNHAKLSEGQNDRFIRLGLRDESEGILEPYIID